MADRERGGFGRGERRGRGERGRGERGRGARRPRREENDNKWDPVTKLGRLVKDGKVTSLEEIYLFSIPIKEYQIVEHFLGTKLKDEVMKVMPVQRQTAAGQRTRFKALVAVGDYDGHIGVGVRVAKEVATAIRSAIIVAKMNLVPVRRGYWGSKVGRPHTIPYKLTGKCGSVRVRLIPAPRGTGLVAAPATKKILAMAGVDDVYTSSTGHTKTMGNFVKACYYALSHSYEFLSPDLWTETVFTANPFQEHTDYLRKVQTTSAATFNN